MAGAGAARRNQLNTPSPVCVRAMSQVTLASDLPERPERNFNREMYDIPVMPTITTHHSVDAEDPGLDAPSKPIGHFWATEELG